jgi:hypothetical protein
MAPSVKPSAQPRLVIEAITMEAKQAEARWEKMTLAIEKLTGRWMPWKKRGRCFASKWRRTVRLFLFFVWKPWQGTWIVMGMILKKQ